MLRFFAKARRIDLEAYCDAVVDAIANPSKKLIISDII